MLPRDSGGRSRSIILRPCRSQPLRPAVSLTATIQEKVMNVVEDWPHWSLDASLASRSGSRLCKIPRIVRSGHVLVSPWGHAANAAGQSAFTMVVLRGYV